MVHEGLGGERTGLGTIESTPKTQSVVKADMVHKKVLNITVSGLL